ncbi:DeoR family transcriptional regulator [Aeromonas caviae]
MDKYSPEERRLLILDLLAAHHKVMAAELAEPLGTTEATIRRDLRHLADEGVASASTVAPSPCRPRRGP